MNIIFFVSINRNKKKKIKLYLTNFKEIKKMIKN